MHNIVNVEILVLIKAAAGRRGLDVSDRNEIQK